MELLDPWSFYNVVLLRMVLEFFNFEIINMSFDIVAEIWQEQYLPFTIPKIRMV